MRDPDPEGKRSEVRRPVTIGRLKRRADFLRAAKGRRWHGKCFSLQASVGDQGSPTAPPGDDAPRPLDREQGVARVGFTVTKKLGGAVIRNRVRRRLREALRLCPDLPARSGHDYVIIARIEAARLSFPLLRADLVRAMKGVHEDKPRDKAKRSTSARRESRP